MAGYFASFLITHVINFGLSFRRLLKITGEEVPLNVPMLTLAAGLAAARIASTLSFTPGRIGAFTLMLACMLYLMRIVRMEDLRWALGLLKPGK